MNIGCMRFRVQGFGGSWFRHTSQILCRHQSSLICGAEAHVARSPCKKDGSPSAESEKRRDRSTVASDAELFMSS